MVCELLKGIIQYFKKERHMFVFNEGRKSNQMTMMKKNRIMIIYIYITHDDNKEYFYCITIITISCFFFLSLDALQTHFDNLIIINLLATF